LDPYVAQSENLNCLLDAVHDGACAAKGREAGERGGAGVFFRGGSGRARGRAEGVSFTADAGEPRAKVLSEGDPPTPPRSRQGCSRCSVAQPLGFPPPSNPPPPLSFAQSRCRCARRPWR
jgi:hypothetical protein